MILGGYIGKEILVLILSFHLHHNSTAPPRNERSEICGPQRAEEERLISLVIRKL